MKRCNFERLKKHSNDNLGQGTDEELIVKLENELEIKLPEEYRQYLLEIGYAELYGDEIYSIYSVPDELPFGGLDWMNKRNEHLKDGFIEFFSNDIDGVFYIQDSTGHIFLNYLEKPIASSFCEFIDLLLDDDN